MDVVVVGGGIVGLSAAYHLAERDTSVMLVEQGPLGAGSTARSAGGIRSQFSTAVNVSLSLASKPVWRSFEERFGVDIEYRRNGYLFLARTEPAAERFRENVAMQRELGAESEFLAPAEATEHCPGLEPEHFVGATYNPDDGVADPNLAVQGYAAGAREGGVEIRTGTTVTDVLVDDGRVVGVEVEGDERLEVDYVVNAAGAWAGRFGELAGADIPISPRRRQVAVVEPSSPVPETDPLTIDLETGSYFRPEREGIALVGGHFGSDDPAVDPDRFDEDMDLEWAAYAVEQAADYTTYFGPDTRIRRGWAGLYGVTPDHHPVIEETRPGFVTAAGFSGHGFQHAPATGRIVAEIVLDGEPSLVDVSMLDAARFEREEHFAEHNVA
ncbi:NAD(P)/FAD-dependent oxidoreductase [Halovivax limisalsi]|uniref:NAD(P)/FAD-dependent oxidoreductase n=1 Tax=Halovivax limisalsi TaxID=1453760 RepID=UPI001FFCB143|nr:FAD-dependent oxidoreductase [Halovivax limisalsi]